MPSLPRFRRGPALALCLVQCLALSLGAGAARADTCETVHQLRDLYSDMDSAYQSGGRVAPDTAREMQLAARRLNPAVIEPMLQDSAIGGRAKAVLAPLETLRRAEPTQVGDVVLLSGLERLTVGRSLSLAVTELGALDCPRPEAPEGGSEAHFWDPAVSGGSGGYGRYTGGGAAFLGMIGLIATMSWMGGRKTKLKQRFICSIPLTLTVSGSGATPAVAADLSREGVKVLVPGGAAPEPGTVVTLSIGERSFAGQVRWSNPHVFGMQLDQRLSKDDLDALLLLSQTDRMSQTRDPKDRGTGAAVPQATQEAAAPAE